MTENEFKLCCIVFYDNFKGKNLQDVMPPTDSWKPVDVVINNCVFDKPYNYLRFINIFATDCIVLFPRKKLIINGRGNEGCNHFKTTDEFLKHFKIELKDIV